MSSRMPLIIVAPHADDEVIGCFEVIESSATMGRSITMLYPSLTQPPSWVTNTDRGFPNWKVRAVVGVDCDVFFAEKPPALPYTLMTFLFPDPIYEHHPEHRRLGAIGERMLRSGQIVLFYSVNMQAPYIREVRDSERKRLVLNTLYPEQATLWEWDHRYFLFEGYCRWIVNCQDTQCV